MALFCKNGGYAPGVCRHMVERLPEAVERAQCAPKSGYALLNDGSDGSNGFVLQKSAADFGERLYRLLSNPRLVVLRREPELFDRRCAITSQ